MKSLDDYTKGSLRKDIPSFNVGDTVNVTVKIIEGEKEKFQVFKGIVIARKGSGLSETFVVRKVSYSEGVERTFYLNSPKVSKLEVVKAGKVRRAKLYYLRKKVGKATKVKESGKEITIPEESQTETQVEETEASTTEN